MNLLKLNEAEWMYILGNFSSVFEYKTFFYNNGLTFRFQSGHKNDQITLKHGSFKFCLNTSALLAIRRTYIYSIVTVRR